MLTADLVKPRLRQFGGELQIRMIEANEHWSRTAGDLIALLEKHAGQPQSAWADALDAYEGDRVDYVVIRGLAKVLSDQATFTPIGSHIAPDDLRQYIFERGPVFTRSDLFYPQSRDGLLQEAADAFDTTPEQVETLLYADRYGAAILTDIGLNWKPVSLIARYNLELARAALYWSNEIEVEIYDTFKDFWRYLKLFKLMFEARIHGEGYYVYLDGPISPFVRSTTRYGRQFAAFLPALFLCQRWQMRATVRPPGMGTALDYRLNDQTPLTSHFRRSGAYDSRMEADFAAEFYEKFGDERGQWLLTREDEVILLGDTVMLPDFALTHKKDGRRALIEIMGFWHPNYLRRKLAKVRAAGLDNLILLVYEGVNLTSEQLADVPAEVLYFKNKPVLKDVLAAVERIAR